MEKEILELMGREELYKLIKDLREENKLLKAGECHCWQNCEKEEDLT